MNEVGAEYVMNYPSNKLSSTKYTIWNFLPLSIIEQLKNVINSFFLFNGGL